MADEALKRTLGGGFFAGCCYIEKAASHCFKKRFLRGLNFGKLIASRHGVLPSSEQ